MFGNVTVIGYAGEGVIYCSYCAQRYANRDEFSGLLEQLTPIYDFSIEQEEVCDDCMEVL